MSTPKTATKPAHIAAHTSQINPALLARAQELLSIPSSADNLDAVRQALRYVADFVATQPRITVEHFERNGIPSFLAYYGPTRPPRFKVLLNGHVDVVPAHAPQFRPRIQDGRLYARGALDMKLQTLLMADAFCQAAPLVDYPLGLQITADEETGGYDGVSHQIAQGVLADFVIAGERTSLNVTTAMKGICWLHMTAEGQHSHGSRPWEGENAVTKLTRLAEKLLAHYPAPTAPVWATTVNVAWIKTDNRTHNRTPDNAEMGLDFRFVADPHFASEESVRTFIASIDPTVQVHFVVYEAEVFAELSDPYVKALMDSAREIRGEVEAIRRYASADTRFYAAMPGTTCVEFGLSGEGDHSDNEYVELASVPIMQAALQKFLREKASTI
ncbi:MAG TPA: M20/M25/M40 family metallo-hydrolase [Candidatus Saccharimonadales bacterium]|nr:M20/M25/M40 family metallo-hydrolase [Candidatus Saccharimonadales bacterium]